MDKLTQFCKFIQTFEGWIAPCSKYPHGSVSWRNKNPGNLKFIGQAHAIGKDPRGFAIFDSTENGFEALKNMVRNAAMGKSKVYAPTDTLVDFFKKYAPSSDGNLPLIYAKNIAKQLKVGVDFQIKNLLS